MAADMKVNLKPSNFKGTGMLLEILEMLEIYLHTHTRIYSQLSN